MPLPILDVLHRGVVYSLMGISAYSIFVGVYGHRERKAALMEKVKGECRPLHTIAICSAVTNNSTPYPVEVCYPPFYQIVLEAMYEFHSEQQRRSSSNR